MGEGSICILKRGVRAFEVEGKRLLREGLRKKSQTAREAATRASSMRRLWKSRVFSCFFIGRVFCFCFCFC